MSICGEITGEPYKTNEADVGMPFRSSTSSKKKVVNQISIFDDLNKKNDCELPVFDYYDPYASCTSSFECKQKKFTSDSTRLDDNVNISGKKKMKLFDRDKFVKNIDMYNIEHINEISINIFNELSKKSLSNFCVFPLGILASLIKNDPSISSIIDILAENKIFFEKHFNNNVSVNRTSFGVRYNTNKCFNYNTNEQSITEIETIVPNFRFGMLKYSNNIMSLNYKNMAELISNIRTFTSGITCHSFKHTNKLVLNSTLGDLGYVKSDNVKYIQTIYFELCEDIYISSTNKNLIFDDAGVYAANFIYYVRYVPNNVLLYIGRRI